MSYEYDNVMMEWRSKCHRQVNEEYYWSTVLKNHLILFLFVTKLYIMYLIIPKLSLRRNKIKIVIAIKFVKAYKTTEHRFSISI